MAKVKEIIVKEDYTKGVSIEIITQITKYSIFRCSNKKLANNKRNYPIKSSENTLYFVSEENLANPLGCNALLITSDGYAVIGKRSKNVGSYAGYLSTLPAGYMEPGEHPQETILRECEEELGVKREEITESYLLGIVRDKNDGHIASLLLLKTNLSHEEIKKRFSSSREGKYEIEELHFVKFEPEKVASYIQRLVPTHKSLLLLALYHLYGAEKTYEALEKEGLGYSSYEKPYNS